MFNPYADFTLLSIRFLLLIGQRFATIGTLIRTKVKDISVFGRYAQGVRIINVKGDEYVASVAPIRECLEGEDEDETAPDNVENKAPSVEV